MEILGVALPENEVGDDFVPPLFPSYHEINDESGDEDEDTDTPTQQIQRFVHPEAISPTVRNVYNIRLQNKTDYVKEEINQSMLFAQVGNYLNKDSLSLL